MIRRRITRSPWHAERLEARMLMSASPIDTVDDSLSTIDDDVCFMEGAETSNELPGIGIDRSQRSMRAASMTRHPVPAVAATETSLSTYSSIVEFGERLLDDVVTVYDYSFARQIFESTELCSCDVIQSFRGANDDNESVSPLTFPDARRRAPVILDGDYVFTAMGEDFVVLDASGDSLREVARLKVGGTTPDRMYLEGNRIIVVYQVEEPNVAWMRQLKQSSSVTIGQPVDNRYNETLVAVIDITRPREPQVVQRTQLEGRLREARVSQEMLQLVLEQVMMPPLPAIVPDPTGQATIGRYESENSYATRTRNEWGDFLHASLPDTASFDGHGELVRAGLMHDATELYVPFDPASRTLYSFVTLDTQANQPGIASAIAIHAVPSAVTYLGIDNAYVTYRTTEGTRIQQVGWGTDGATPRLQASTLIPEVLQEPTVLGEWNGNLIALARTPSPAEWPLQAMTFRREGEQLSVVGRMDVLGGYSPTAAEWGIRFQGPIMQVPHAEAIDYYDMADPEQPRRVLSTSSPEAAGTIVALNDTRFVQIGPVASSGVTLFEVRDGSATMIDSAIISLSGITDKATLHYDSLSQIVMVARIVETWPEFYSIPRPAELRYGKRSEVDVYRVVLEEVTSQPRELVPLGHYTVNGELIANRFVNGHAYSITTEGVVKANVTNEGMAAATMEGLTQPRKQQLPPSVVDHLADSQIPLRLERLRQAWLPLASTAEAAGAIVPVAIERHGERLDVIVNDSGSYEHWRDEAEQATLIDAAFEFTHPDEWQAVRTWTNSSAPSDVNNDGYISPLDVLLVINQLNSSDTSSLLAGSVLRQITPPRRANDPFWDVNGDGSVSPLDALLVINRL